MYGRNLHQNQFYPWRGKKVPPVPRQFCWASTSQPLIPGDGNVETHSDSLIKCASLSMMLCSTPEIKKEMMILKSFLTMTLLICRSDLVCLNFWKIGFLLGCLNICLIGLFFVYPPSFYYDCWLLLFFGSFEENKRSRDTYFCLVLCTHTLYGLCFGQFILVLALSSDCSAESVQILVLPKKIKKRVCYFIWINLFLSTKY